ncbi:HAMP domain-containing sensor histidine kinase [Bombiscardovia coagulans]|uniref:histidine kinase n=1 Tax=Bombiscardovia coagulans TaxID=686666 RepID=A0A261ETC8_9BIFI|nr:HAMP domain-containing sensor histidine kinase [Bombiscardovia coagulans]OZG50107.1 two-component system sensor histidine kinase [Bombiscardovia coagulans]
MTDRDQDVHAQQAPFPNPPSSLKEGEGASGAQEETAAGRRFKIFDAIPLTTKLIVCMLVLLIIDTLGISLAIRQMAGTYLQQKTDTQLIRQANLGIRNATLLSQEDLNKNGLGPTDYFLQIRDSDMNVISQNINPLTANGALSVPTLPEGNEMDHIVMGKPFTTSSKVVVAVGTHPDRESLNRAQAPWRVVAMQWSLESPIGAKTTSGVLFMGLSLSDQLDTIHALTQYCWMVGILVVLLGGVIAALLIQNTLAPLKRIEKTAAKIAAGDLSQRIPAAPVNTEVGSLAVSLNSMLTRIERSFREQEETTRKMKQFVSDASHELRTPLAAIHGYAELYRMQRNYPGALERADESIAHIEASSARMTDLVQDLLSLARLDEGQGIDTTLDVNLTAIVNDAVDDLHALDPDRNIDRGFLNISWENHGDSKELPILGFHTAHWDSIDIEADPTRLRQVVTNIVGNIHRYTPTDTPVQIGLGLVWSTCEPDDLVSLPSVESSLKRFLMTAHMKREGGLKKKNQTGPIAQPFVILQFVDHGPGASLEARNHIFERFYTADPSRAREKGGTGLGLAIVESIVRGHHGLICASETPGGGLTFTVVIPQSRLSGVSED